MTVEHRAAPGLADVAIELADDGQGPALRLRQQDPDDVGLERPTPEERVVQALADSGAPLSQRQIRERAATRPATVAEALRKLVREERVERLPEGGYRIADAEDAAAQAAAVNGRGHGQALPRARYRPNP